MADSVRVTVIVPCEGRESRFSGTLRPSRRSEPGYPMRLRLASELYDPAGTQLADRHELPVLLVEFAKLILQHGQQPCLDAVPQFADQGPS